MSLIITATVINKGIWETGHEALEAYLKTSALRKCIDV
jgi:hypothetical protein